MLVENIIIEPRRSNHKLSTEDIKKYVECKIKSDPISYGGDNGNMLIVYEFFKDVFGIEVPKYFDSKAGSLIRAKNKYLEQHPEYDNRVVNKRKQPMSKDSTIMQLLEDT